MRHVLGAAAKWISLSLSLIGPKLKAEFMKAKFDITLKKYIYFCYFLYTFSSAFHSSTWISKFVYILSETHVAIETRYVIGQCSSKPLLLSYRHLLVQIKTPPTCYLFMDWSV